MANLIIIALIATILVSGFVFLSAEKSLWFEELTALKDGKPIRRVSLMSRIHAFGDYLAVKNAKTEEEADHILKLRIFCEYMKCGDYMRCEDPESTKHKKVLGLELARRKAILHHVYTI